MTSTMLHLRYARALFNLATENKFEEQLVHDLKALSDLFQHKKVGKLMSVLAQGSQDIREKIIDSTFEGKVHPFLLNLLKLLASSNGISLVPKIYQAYSQLYHQAKGIDEVMIFTARALAKDEEHALIKQLEDKKKKKITAHFEVKPELIGGVQIYEHGYVLDYSVQHYLEQLQHHLLQQKLANELDEDVSERVAHESDHNLATGEQQSLL